MNNSIYNLVIAYQCYSISFTAETGQYFRKPIYGIYNHTAICLGVDVSTGERLFIHHHQNSDYPCIVTESELRGNYKGDLFVIQEPSPFGAMEIVYRAANLANQRIRYALLFANCQHFTDEIYFGIKKSVGVQNSLIAVGTAFLFSSFQEKNNCKC